MLLSCDSGRIVRPPFKIGPLVGEGTLAIFDISRYLPLSHNLQFPGYSRYLSGLVGLCALERARKNPSTFVMALTWACFQDLHMKCFVTKTWHFRFECAHACMFMESLYRVNNSALLMSFFLYQLCVGTFSVQLLETFYSSNNDCPRTLLNI